MSTTTFELTTADGKTTGPVPIEALDEAASELFDGTKYDLPIPKLDGHRADVLKLSFGGSVELDLVRAGNLDHFDSLKFGQEVELQITAIVGKKQWSIRRNDETGEETVTHTIGLAVHSYEETA